MDIIKSLYANKLTEDDRDAILSIDIASWDLPTYIHEILGGHTKFHILAPDIRFYISIFAMFTIQTVVAVVLAAIMYHLIILPQKQVETNKKNLFTTQSFSFICGYGIIMPFIVVETILLKDYLEIESCAIRMASLTMTLPLLLRTIEAMHGCTPIEAQTSRLNYIIYISCLLTPLFVDGGRNHGKLKRVTKVYLLSKLKKFLREYILITMLMSYLAHHEYEPFLTRVPYDSLDHNLGDMFSFNQLMNNYLAAVLLSLSLSQSTMGLSLYYAMLYRVQTIDVVMNPFMRSTSPSDFWGRRWNRFIHDTLKNGVFKPVRKHHSKYVATLATFIVSGLIHELVIFILFDKASYNVWKIEGRSDLIYGKNMIFFAWNAILIMFEWVIGKWKIFGIMKMCLPRTLVAFMVVLTALPLAHLFLGDWIKGRYFQHVQLGEFLIVIQDSRHSR